MRRITVQIMAVFVLCAAVFVVQAQNAPDQSAVLTVTYEGVEFIRLNTTQPFALRESAVLPMRAGDVIRTDAFGRALIDFAGSQMLVLPFSVVKIDVYTTEQVAFTVESGRVVIRLGAMFEGEFALNGGNTVIDAPSTHFGMQVQDGVTTIISAVGTLYGLAEGQPFEVVAGSGVQVRGGAISLPIDLGGENNFARVDALLDGCPGTIQARGELSLNVRIGPSLGYDTLGSIPNGTPVYLMAVSPNGERYRVQFLNGFGWVLANGVTHRCADLPVLPYSAVETIIRVRYIDDLEYALLRPLFGALDYDPIFYIVPEAQEDS